MYKEHTNFIQPNDEEVKVWRYMDFTKLISLIDSQRLFFTRADNFNDPFEGSYPKINVQAREELPSEITKDMTRKEIEILAESFRKSGELNKHWPRYIAINCWHMNDQESAAMWGLYLKSNEGVAIQSTYSKLKRSLTDEAVIFIGTVKYIDYDIEFIKSGNILSPFVHKRKSFEHEKEVRAIYMKWPVDKGVIDFSVDTIEYGVEIKTELEVLIEKIYVAPNSPVWFFELVCSAVNRYGYNFEVVHSRLIDSPLF